MMPFKTALHSVSYAGLWGQARLALPDFLRKARASAIAASCSWRNGRTCRCSITGPTNVPR